MGNYILNEELLKKGNFYSIIQRTNECFESILSNLFDTIGSIEKDIILNRGFLLNASIQTLNILDKILLKDDIVDVYVLLRKIRDNCIYTSYFVDKSNMNKTDNNKLNSLLSGADDEKINLYEIVFTNKCNVFKSILNDTVIEDKINSKIDHKVFKNELREEYKEILNEVNNVYSEINIKLNNYVHGNGISYISNYFIIQSVILKSKDKTEIHKNLIELIKDISLTLEKILHIFLIFIYFINPLLLKSEDGFDNYITNPLYLCPCIENELNIIRDRFPKTYKKIRENNIFDFNMK